MAIARKDVVTPGEDGMYHITARCVRRAFLCGLDRLSGKCFDHRKGWLRERLKFLLTLFTIDTLAYAIMSNHLHLLIRISEAALEALTDEDVARRWLLLYPRRRETNGMPAEPNAVEIGALTSQTDRIKELRQRLGSVSWFMKSMSEFLARRANKEDDCTGRFWEGRFNCEKIASEAAALQCAMYIDLNPIRAKIANTPEESLFTSVWERLEERKSDTESDSWLAPLEERGDGKGFLPISFQQYLELLDWTGRQISLDKKGSIPDNLAPILERLGINKDYWIDSVENRPKWFCRFAGDASQILAAAATVGKSWFKGINSARKLFVATAGA